MQQTFFKTIKGHKLEFNRLIYPLRYHVSLKDNEVNGIIILVKKNEDGIWGVASTGSYFLPYWFDTISPDVHRCIEENETSVVNSYQEVRELHSELNV